MPLLLTELPKKNRGDEEQGDEETTEDKGAHLPQMLKV